MLRQHTPLLHSILPIGSSLAVLDHPFFYLTTSPFGRSQALTDSWLQWLVVVEAATWPTRESKIGKGFDNGIIISK
jgi:hypothetical protein